MNTLGNRRTAWLCGLLAILLCEMAEGQPGPRAGARPERTRLAQAEQPIPPERGLGGPRGARPGPEGPGGPPRSWNEVPEPQRKQVERFMEEHFPRLYVEMQRLKDRNEVRYARRMTRIAPQMRKIMETMRTDPQRGMLMIREKQIEFEIRQNVARYRNAKDDSAKRQVREHLEVLAGKAFDCRNERRQMEVRELEARLSELQTRLSESQNLRPALIRQRVAEMLAKPEPQLDGDDDDRDRRPEEPETEPD